MNCSKEQEAGGLGEPGAWELLGAAGTCSVVCTVHVVAPGNRATAWKCHRESTSCGAGCFLSWQFPGPGVVLAWSCLSAGQAVPAPGVMSASAMLRVNSWGHSCSAPWDWGSLALEI